MFDSGVSKSERTKRGVAIAIHSKHKSNITNWEEIDERIITVKLTKNEYDIVIVGVYAPKTNPEKKFLSLATQTPIGRYGKGVLYDSGQ